MISHVENNSSHIYGKILPFMIFLHYISQQALVRSRIGGNATLLHRDCKIGDLH